MSDGHGSHHPGTGAPAHPAPPTPNQPPVGPSQGVVANGVGVIRDPAATFRRIAAHRPMGQAVVVVVVVVALSTVAQALAPATAPELPAAMAAVLGVLIGIPLGLLWFVVWTGAMLGLARAFGGTGDFAATLSGLGFAYIPLLFGGVVGLIGIALGTGAAPFVMLVFAATAIWSLVLDVFAIREAHAITTGRAVGVVVLTMAILAAIAIFFAFVMVLLLFAA